MLRITEAAGVAIHLAGSEIPLGAAGVTPLDAVSSGEEYALAFTVSPDKAKFLENSVKERLNREIYKIGELCQGAGVFMDGEDISGLGYEHKF
jgi:thiamine monophosphate kinase